MRGIAGALVAACGLAVLLGSVAPATSASAAPRDPIDGFEYVALGDSYQAGFGLTPYSDTSPFADGPLNGCYQALANYPQLVATDLGLTITDETCSGAVTANIGYASGVTIPSPPATGPLTGLPTGSQVQTTMAGKVAPAVQSAALSATTDIVTIGIGGNDLGFASIAMACVRDSVGASSYPLYLYWVSPGITFDNCKQYFDDQVTYPDAYLKDRLATYVVPRLEATLTQVKAAAPNAQVFVVGYPQIAPADATDACFTSPTSVDAVPLSGVDINFVHEIEGLLDEAIESAAAAHGAHYINTWDDTAANTLCTPEPWIWGLTAYVNLSGPCDPGYINGDSSGWICVKLGALHPNAGGVENIRQLVAATIPTAFFTRIVDGSFEPGGSVTVEGGGFWPGESVELVLHSTPVTIATVTANAAGGFATTAAVPSSVPPGAHTLVATGLTSGHAFSASVALAMPATGAEFAGPAVAGALLLLIGGALIVAARRRPTA